MRKKGEPGLGAPRRAGHSGSKLEMKQKGDAFLPISAIQSHQLSLTPRNSKTQTFKDLLHVST